MIKKLISILLVVTICISISTPLALANRKVQEFKEVQENKDEPETVVTSTYNISEPRANYANPAIAVLLAAGTKIANSQGWNALVRWATRYGDKGQRVITIVGLKVFGPSSPSIAASKINYLLTNSGKAPGFNRLGYTLKNASKLKDLIYKQGQRLSKSGWSDASYGMKFERIDVIKGANGKMGRLTTVWQCDWGTKTPKLVTSWVEVYR